MVTAGLRSTELWLTVATNVALTASALAGALPPKWAAVSASVASAAYAVSRGIAKVCAAPPASPGAK